MLLIAPINQGLRMNKTRHRGSSLLEVMIAILVLSFGLLGLGGLAAAAQRYVKMAQFQSIGTLMAADLGERMRGNIDGFRQGRYVRANAYSAEPVTVALPTCTSSVACTVTEMAAIDMAEWVGEVQKRLPGGDAHVKLDAANALATDIWILWMDPLDGSAVFRFVGSAGFGSVRSCFYRLPCRGIGRPCR
jgi:type IV pilus assembly protein PilV